LIARRSTAFTLFPYTTLFRSCYEMVCQFLQEEGYGDIPLPENASEFLLFRTPAGRQLALFEDNGYLHNPIKILFPADGRKKNRLDRKSTRLNSSHVKISYAVF